MQLERLSSQKRLVYSVHKFMTEFRPYEKGSAIGFEFEEFLRSKLTSSISPDLISSRRDLGFGQSLHSRSGLVHELDLVLRLGNELYVFEMKHFAESSINKDMVMIFNQKVLDYYVENYKPLKDLKIYRIFVTRTASIDPTIRQFCAMWGILLIDREMYSPPIAEIVLKIIEEETSDKFIPGCVTRQEQEALQKQANYLSSKMWRSLETFWSPQASFSSKLSTNFEQVPAARITKGWVIKQNELSKQVKSIKTSYAEWQIRKRAIYG